MSENEISPIHLWVPDFFGTGGIQHYSRMLTQGLCEIQGPAKVRVISKKGRGSADSAPCKIICPGDLPSRWQTPAFVSLLAWQTFLHRPALAILTHLHFAPLASWLKRTVGLRYWVAVHGLEIKSLSRTLRKGLENAERLLPVSRFARELLARQEIDLSRCSILPNCIDPDRFYQEKKPAHLLRLYGLNSRHKILFTLARLDARERYKGYDRVLEALPEILRLVPEAHYILAGGGDDTARIRRLIRQLGLQGKVTLTGFLPEQTLREHYNLCDLFVMPSRGEGFGIVFLEALACGRPVISGKEDGSAEPLADGSFGRLIDPRSRPELVDAATKILLRTVPETESSSAGREAMLARFGFPAFKRNVATLLAP